MKKTDFVLLKKSSSKKIFSSLFFNLKQYFSGGGPSRFAVVASSAVFKKAVERNKAKRRIRGVVLEQADNFKDGFNAVIYLKNTRNLTVKTYISNQGGQYRFSGLDPNADYEIHAEHNDMTSSNRTISSFDNRKEMNVTLKVDKEKEKKGTK